MILKNFFGHKHSIRVIRLGLVFSILLSLAACSGNNDDDLVGNWVRLSDLVGVSRTAATGTVVGDYGYLGLGFDENDNYLKDFWKYDPTTDDWTRIADFPGVGRVNAVSFSANGKLYVGSGWDGTTNDCLSDFYEYDPSTLAWTQIEDIPADGRKMAIAFSINDIGYVGCGIDGDGNVLKDFYAYSSSTGWYPITAIGGTKRQDAVAFVIDGKAYVATGLNKGTYVSTFFRYNPDENSWTQLRSIADVDEDEDYDDDYDDIVRNRAATFTINGKGYIATGGKNSAGSVVWEYNPTTDLWVEKTSFEGSSRYYAVGFTINDKGYIATGQNSSYYFDDIWRFDPNAEQDDGDNGN